MQRLRAACSRYRVDRDDNEFHKRTFTAGKRASRELEAGMPDATAP
jgi:hypothetical protein